METRDIRINLEVAKKLYNSNDAAIKGLALQAFSRDELELPSIKSIVGQLLEKSYLTEVQKIQLTSLNNRKGDNISAPKMLRVLALYYNNGKTRKGNGGGYFFTKSSKPGISSHPKVLGVDWVIIKHETVNYPGLVYFLKEEDCRKAFDIMKRAGKLDNLYSDL